MSEARRFQGIAYWEKSINASKPYITNSFLRRNVRHALDRQQSYLLLERGNELAAESIGADRFAGWDYPSPDRLKELIKSNTPMIRLENIALRHATGARVKPPRHRNRSARSGSPDWLPAESEWKAPCQVSIRLLYQTAPKSVFYQSSRCGHILRHDHPTKDSAFEVVLESSFEIPLTSLEVFVDYKDRHGNNQWKLARDDDKVSMECRIQCNGSAASAELWSQLECRDISEYVNVASDEGHMKCTWHDLPNLPASGSLLELKRSQNKKLKEMRYKAELGIAWTLDCPPLAMWNRSWQLRQQESSRQLPTPSVSDDSEQPRKMRAQYLNRQNGFVVKSAVATGLHCVFLTCHERAEHSSLERLMLHYAIHHDHMQFKVSPERSEGNLAVIFMSPAEDTLASLSSRDQQFTWQAPDSAFDVKAHLKGTKPWAVTHLKSNGQSASNTLQKSPRKRPQAGGPDRSSQIPFSLGRSEGVEKRPEDVLNLPEVPRKRHRVPQVENISFYRTLSKQKVPAGEEISDSEAEADTDWAVQIQRREQTLLGTDRITQNFNELFNKHLDQEQPMSDMFVQEAVVRFARKYSTQLSQHGWKEAFRDRLEQFEDKKIIRPSHVTYCMALLVNSAEVDTETLRGATPIRRPVKGLSVRRETESEARTPERGSPMSPLSRMSTKKRLRWRDGNMSQEERDAATKGAPRSAARSLTPIPAVRRRQTIPLGRRKVICWRSSRASQLHSVSDFLRNDLQALHDDIQPSDLQLSKFNMVLDKELALRRNAEIIVCTSIDPARPILDDRDWEFALTAFQDEDIAGDIMFELRPRSSLENLMTEIVKRQRNEGHDGLARKQVRIEGDRCLCGVEAQGLRGIIACANPRCSRQFHLRCLHLQKRPASEWFCVDCR